MSNPQPAMRIATLLPSITEIVASIPSLRDSIIAVTHECDHPKEVVDRCERITTSFINPKTMTQAEIDRRVKGSMAVGHSLYSLDEEKLKRADPTIVFTQALCDVCAPAFPYVLSTCVRVLGEDPRIISIEPECLAEVMDSVRIVGRETNCSEEADGVARGLEAGFQRIREAVADLPRPKVAFLEWTDPLFNGGHWIPDMMEIAGAEYSMTASRQRSAEITPQQLVQCDPDYILVAPCGFDSARAAKDALQLWQHDWWTELRAVKSGQVFALDGNAYYARPGPRLLQGTGIIARLIHGEGVGAKLGDEIAPKHWLPIHAPSAEDIAAIKHEQQQQQQQQQQVATNAAAASTPVAAVQA